MELCTFLGGLTVIIIFGNIISSEEIPDKIPKVNTLTGYWLLVKPYLITMIKNLSSFWLLVKPYLINHLIEICKYFIAALFGGVIGGIFVAQAERRKNR